MAAQPFQEAPNNQTCQFCKGHRASHYCDCVKPPALFCLDCSVKQHSDKFPRTIHRIIPIAALNQSPEEYQRKSEWLAQATAELRKNLDRIDQFSVEFAEMMQGCIDYCVHYRTWGLQQLQTEKEELQNAIESAIEEVTACVDQCLEPMSPLGQVVWKFPDEQLQMFISAVSVPELQTLCQSWAQYHIYRATPAAKQDVSVFAAINRVYMELYDVNTKQTTLHSLSSDLGNGRSYITLHSPTVMCLGGQPASSEVSIFHLPSVQLISLSPLLTARNGAGVAKTHSFVYVFGGDDAGNCSCEKYALKEGQWMALGSMTHPRQDFTPCTFRAIIYLPCPKTTPVIESFSPDTEMFTELRVTLPTQMQGFESVAFVSRGELCVLGNRRLGRWVIDWEKEFRLSATSKDCSSSQPPLIVGSLVLICNGWNVEKFSLENYSFR